MTLKKSYLNDLLLPQMVALWDSGADRKHLSLPHVPPGRSSQAILGEEWEEVHCKIQSQVQDLGSFFLSPSTVVIDGHFMVALGFINSKRLK